MSLIFRDRVMGLRDGKMVTGVIYLDLSKVMDSSLHDTSVSC